MPDKVTVHEASQIIQIESYGNITIEDLWDSLDAVFKIRLDRGLENVFIDASKQTAFPSTLPVYEFGERVATSVQGMRFAIITGPATRGAVDVLKAIVCKRGGQVNVFTSADAAITWLTEDSNITQDGTSDQ